MLKKSIALKGLTDDAQVEAEVKKKITDEAKDKAFGGLSFRLVEEKTDEQKE